MADTIEVKYKADLSGIIKDTDTYEKTLKNVETTSQTTFKKVEDNSKKASAGIKDAAKQAESSLGGIDKALEGVAEGVAAAFAVEKILEFAKESVKAYADQQKGETQLLFALNGRKGVQQELIRSAEKLGKATAIEPDLIVKQQAFLAIQGRTTEEINKTIHAAIELSARTGEDLNSSVRTLSATYEGVTRGLVQFDGKIKDLTKTELENGGAVDLINEKYKGFAESTVDTVAGKMALMNIQIEETKQKLGKELAPILLNVEQGFLNFADGVLKGIGALIDFSGAVSKARQDQLTETQEQEKDLVRKEFANKKEIDLIRELGDARNKAINQEAERRKLGTDNVDVIEIAKTQARIKALKELLDERQEVINKASEKELVTLKNLKEKLADLQSQQESVVDPLGTGKAQSDLLLKQQKEVQAQIDEITGKAAEERLKKEQSTAEKLAAQRKSASDKLKDQTLKDQQDALAEQNTDAIKKLEQDQKNAEENARLLFEQGDKTKADAENLAADLVAIEQKYGAKIKQETIKQAEELRKINEKNKEEDLKDTLSAINNSTEFSINKLKEEYIKKGDFSEKAQSELNNKISQIIQDGLRVQIQEAEKAGQDTTQLTKKFNDEIVKNNQDKNKEILDQDKAATEARKKLLGEILNAVGDVTAQAFALFEADNQARQDALQEQTDKETEIFNTKQDELDKLKERGLITDREAQRRQIELTEQRTAAEKKAANEQKKLKTEAALLSRELAIFEIILNTAKGIIAALGSTPPNPFLAAAIGVTGALELATAVSTPLPKFFKGTKSVQGKEGIDQVPAMLTKGERVVTVEKNKQNWEYYEAIDEGKLEQLIMRKHIVPALQEYKRKQEAEYAKRANEEIGRVIYANFAGLTGAEAERLQRKGTTINNTGELGYVIGEAIKEALPRQKLGW